MKEIREKFSVIKDKRHQGYIDHKLCDILIIVICGVLCGLDKLADIMVFTKNKSEFLKSNFGIDLIPSKPTMSRALSMMKGDEVAKMAKIIIEIMSEYSNLKDEIIAVDGKAIRSTLKKGEPHSTLRILTAYLTESSVVLGQASIHEKPTRYQSFKMCYHLYTLRVKQ